MAGTRTAGIDWASEAHEVCVSEEGRVNERFSATHDERGIVALAGKLLRLGVCRVAIERPDGILVERLLAAGLEVLAIHPNQVKAARARFAVAHGKSDRFDAYVLAELARTDAHRFRVLAPDSDQTKALRTLTRAREDLVGARVELANQLRAQLQAFWPGALLFADVDSPISLAFISRYPSPADAKGLGAKRMAAFLQRHAYSGRTDPAELVARISAAPQGTAGQAEREARRIVVAGLVTALGPIVEEIAKLSAQIRSALAAHPDAAIFRPLFRDPRTAICPATLVAEIGDCRERYPTEAALAADAGMSPVALESGKLRVATFRRACDKRLRSAVATLADTTRHWHPWAREVYRRARARGQDHPHAIRTLGRAWIRVLWRCWRDEVPYDPARHGNFNRLQMAGG
ncbi:MAG TPA: IS110 family transposase [Solirubrobacterales bacterium]|jgi:transposase|nr:IS110 family transposase [Solirubrobacterales bacterium]